MSAPLLPADPAERDTWAAEYVLGTLDARGVAAVRAAMDTDPELRAAVAAWEARLAPLTRLAPPEAPPPDLWERIDSAIAPAAVARPVAAPRPGRFWQFWSLGASFAAAGFAALLLVPAPPPAVPDAPARLAAVLLPERASAWTAEVDRAGNLRLAAIPSSEGSRAMPPVGRAFEVWSLAPDAKMPAAGASAREFNVARAATSGERATVNTGAYSPPDPKAARPATPAEKPPVSLGQVPRDAAVIDIPAAKLRAVKGQQIVITVEPEALAPSAAPTGTVVFAGRLREQ